MIDLKELRVGAHVDFNGARVEILGIDVTDDEYAPIIIKTTIASVEPDEIDPIPLTPELLTELGFEEQDAYGEVSVWKHDNLIVNIIGERKVISFADKIYSLEARYLHQLENFVYQTTKYELIK